MCLPCWRPLDTMRDNAMFLGFWFLLHVLFARFFLVYLGSSTSTWSHRRWLHASSDATTSNTSDFMSWLLSTFFSCGIQFHWQVCGKKAPERRPESPPVGPKDPSVAVVSWLHVPFLHVSLSCLFWLRHLLLARLQWMWRRCRWCHQYLDEFIGDCFLSTA